MLEEQVFWQYIDFTQKELLKQSFFLLNWSKKQKSNLFDFSFIVMPAAKAYEGFLKKLLFDLKLISKQKFEDDYFRIGKALNPELEHVKRLKKECLYNELSANCSEDVAKMLWQTWKKCRNRLFHYFPNEQLTFTLQESEERLKKIVKTMSFAVKQCNL